MGVPVRYEFESIWRVPVNGVDPAERRAAVYTVLQDVAGYPSWWRQVRKVEPTGDRVGTVVIRSALPIRLKLELTGRRDDPRAGVLAAELTGDLTGFCSWQVATTDREVLVRFLERVDVTGSLFGRLAKLARPLLGFNHRRMMNAGRRGLLARLG